MDYLRCVVERITYQNTENGYSVIKCKAKGYSDLVTVVGNMPEVHVGSVLSLGGNWKMDAKYGRQFSMETFEETLPATAYGIEKYLGSGLVKGIGPKFAGRIVRQFGKDTLEIIETEPDRLLEVPGIGKTRVDRIRKSWEEQKEIKNIMLFLQGHDVSTSHATKIYKQYGNDHSVFIAFAPKDKPKIAVAVYVENAQGGGGTWAAPIASLVIEKYIRGEVTRKDMEKMYREINPCQKLPLTRKVKKKKK